MRHQPSRHSCRMIFIASARVPPYILRARRPARAKVCILHTGVQILERTATRKDPGVGRGDGRGGVEATDISEKSRKTIWSQRHRLLLKRALLAPPAIVAGRFAGRTVDALTDAELKALLISSPNFWLDNLALYWSVKYEIEKRRAEVGGANTCPEILEKDSPKDLAHKLIRYAFRAASKRCHSDLGGSDDLFRKLKEAEAMLLGCVERK